MDHLNMITIIEEKKAKQTNGHRLILLTRKLENAKKRIILAFLTNSKCKKLLRTKALDVQIWIQSNGMKLLGKVQFFFKYDNNNWQTPKLLEELKEG